MSDEQKRSDWDPPAGHYVMRLDEAKVKKTAEDDKPYLAVTFWIAEGTDPRWVDREWRKRMYLTPNAEKYTKQDLQRMGASRQAIERPELLAGERVEFECDVVYSGRWANLKNISTRIALHPVPPTGAPEPEPEPEPEEERPFDPKFDDW